VIIGIVVVLSLVVVGLVVTQMQSGSSVASTSQNIGLKTQSLALIESVLGADTNGVIVIQNNTGEDITVRKIVVDGVDHNFDDRIVSGANGSFSLVGLVACDASVGKKVVDVKIVYETSLGLSKTISYGSISIDCVPTVNPSGNVIQEDTNQSETPPIETTQSHYAYFNLDSNYSNGLFNFTKLKGNDSGITFDGNVQTVSSDGLVALWHLDEKVIDSTENENDGMASGGTNTTLDSTLPSGLGGRAGKFDGSNDKISLPNVAEVSALSVGAVSAWIKKSTTAEGVVLAIGPSGGNDPYMMLTTAETAFFYSPDAVFGGSTTISDGVWHHVVWTQDGSGLKIYVDGHIETLDGSTTTWFSDYGPVDLLAIGVLDRSSPYSYFTGGIDDLRIYSRALEQSDIDALYNSTNGTESESGALGNGLVAHYKMNENTWKFKDSSGVGLNGVALANTDTLNTTGKINGALSFDTTNNKVEISDNSALALTSTDFSISAWVYLNSYGNGGAWECAVLTRRPDYTYNNWDFFIRGAPDAPNTGKLSMLVGTSSSVNHSTGVVPLGQWTLVTMVYTVSTQNVTFYLNDDFDSSVDSTGLVDNEVWNVRMGGTGGEYGGNNYIDGNLDDVRIYARALTADDVIDLYNSTNGTESEEENLGEDLLVHYKMNDNSASTTVIESTGNAKAAIPYNTKTTNGLWDTGSGSFDGSGDYVILPGAALPYGSVPMTYSLWFYPTEDETYYVDDSGPWVGMMSSSDMDGGAQTSFIIIAVNDHAECGTSESIGAHFWTANICTDKKLSDIGINKWHNIVLNYNGSDTQELYIDGVLEGTSNYSLTIDPGDGMLGYRGMYQAGNMNNFKGDLDEVSVWNRALGGPEILSLYNSWKTDANYSKIIDTNSLTTDYNFITFNSNNGVDKNGYLYGTQIEPTIEKDLNNGLVGLWHLNGDAIDSTGKSSTGTWEGNETYTTGLWSTQSASFDTSSTITSIAADELDLNRAVTISAWFNTSSSSPGSIIRYVPDMLAIVTSWSSLNSDYEHKISFGGANGGTCNYFNSDSIITSEANVDDGKWHLVTAGYDGSNLFLYLDGVYQGGASCDPDYQGAKNNTFYFGKHYSGVELFDGKMDEVALWNRALSPTEINELFNKGAAKIGIQYRSCSTSDCSSGTTSWSDLNYSAGLAIDLGSTFDSKRYFQILAKPTLYEFPDTSTIQSAFATLTDVNLIYTN